TGDSAHLDIPLSAKLVTDVTHGALTLNADGSFTFTPEKDFVGAATFTYQAVMSPPAGSPILAPSPNSKDIATVTNYVKPLNPPPVARNDFYPVLQDTTLTVAAPGVLSNDTGPTGHQLTVSLGDSTTNGLLMLNADGSFVYTPNSGFTGYDKFSYKVT